MVDPDGEPKLGDERIALALSAQKLTPMARPKRFFKEARVVERETDFALLLDDRPAKTPARRDLALPSRAAAEAVAAEWNALGDVIDPGLLPLTRIVNAAIDGVVAEAAAVEAEITHYVGTDLLLYRAGEPEPLVAAQAQAWDPILDWCRHEFGARFFLAEGIMHVEQPAATLSVMARVIADAVGQGPGGPLRVAALSVMTTLTGSALLALAVVRRRLSAEEAWAAAHVDETFQESRWGEDDEAMKRREARGREMRAAALLAALA